LFHHLCLPYSRIINCLETAFELHRGLITPSLPIDANFFT
jgi:hypothetical protein